MNRQRLVVGFGMVVVVAAGIGAGVRWQQQTTRGRPSPPDSVQSRDIMLDQRSRGSTTAPITVYEFSDFQCPFCRAFWEETFPVIEREYIATGKLRLTFVNYPIPRLHPNATAAHNFAMCAARQGRFWPAHDLLFGHQKQWETLADPAAYFRALGDSASLDRPALAACVSKQVENWLVQADSREAEGAGITGTPAFVINGGLLPGAQPIEVWRPILDSIYRAAKPKGPERTAPTVR